MTYAALGFDPAPGDVSQVAGLVSTLRSVAAEVGGVRSDLQAIGQVGGAWIGQSATAFVGTIGELPTYLDRASNSTDTALRALSNWQQELEDFQRRGRTYEHRAEEAKQRIASARTALNATPEADAGMSERQATDLHDRAVAAQRAVGAADDELAVILGAARDMLGEHQARADQVARLVRRAADDAPPEPGFWDRIASGLQSIGDFLADIANNIAEWVREHAELFKQIGDLLADLALIVGIVALFVTTGPILIAAGALALGALAFHAAAMAGGHEEVTASTLVLDALGVVSAGLGVAGLRLVQAGRATMAGARWFNVGTKLRGFVDLAAGKTMVWQGNLITGGGSAASMGVELHDQGPGWRDIPVVGPTAGLVDYFTDDDPKTARGPASVNSAGRAFTETVASHRPRAAAPAPVG